MRRASRFDVRLLIGVWLGALNGVAVAQTVPVIEGGREAEVQALFAPHGLGAELEDGWRFESLQIEAHVIRVGVVREGVLAQAILSHPDRPDESDTASFATSFGDATPEAHRALQTLMDAVRNNDVGGFWRVRANPTPSRWDVRTSRGYHADGLVWTALLFLWVLLLAFKASRDATRFERRALIAVVLIGALLRFTWSPEMLLGAWIYSRTTELQRLIWYGPVLTDLSSAAGLVLRETEVMRNVGLAFACITPLAVFAHGRWLLGSTRRGLIAALVLAALPLHLRFSASEVAFIPSIVLSSALFATVHLALSSTRTWRVVAVVACLPLTIAVVAARPLNLIFIPLVLIVVAGLGGKGPQRKLRWALGLMIAGAGLTMGVLHVWGQYSDNVQEGLSLEVITEALALVVDWQRNTLINPRFTPPLLLGLAIWGVVKRRKEERGRLLFLGAWLVLFFVTHAYVVPRAPAMQARYHLHLIVPFSFLAVIGLDTLLRLENQTWRRWGGRAAYAAIGLMPLMHVSFIRDVEFNDHREYSFVESMREVIPRDCTIVEFAGEDGRLDARFRRIGHELDRGRARYRWNVVDSGAFDPNTSGCLYYYEGLPCFAQKEPSESVAPACEGLRRAASWEPVAERRFESRIYDGNLARGFGPDQSHLTLTLYRRH